MADVDATVYAPSLGRERKFGRQYTRRMRRRVTLPHGRAGANFEFMDRAQKYRERAAEFRTKAESAVSVAVAAELKKYADIYLRLASQAERNDMADLVYEPPPPKLR